MGHQAQVPFKLIQPNPHLFDVLGTHTYSVNGTETVNIQITDQGGATAPATSTITVASFLTAQGTTITPTEGKAFTSIVATVHDPNTTPQLTATITWGDGTQSTGTITAIANQPGNFDVTGTHTYVEENNNVPISIKVVDGTATATASSTANIIDPPVIALPIPFLGQEGKTLNNALVAVFTDPAGSNR